MILPLELLCAFLLDLLVGDPRWLPHPVRIIGRAISSLEKVIRSFCKSAAGERLGGVLLVLAVTLSSFAVAALIVAGARQLPGALGGLVGSAVLVYLASTTLALRGLVDAARAVIEAVREQSIDEARRSLGMIVGRDTGNLAEKDILKATMETLAENLSDGIIAPLFYLTLGGLPLAITYKAINTLDSMVGYKNDTYRFFGWAAARLDDAANYIPARLTGGLLIAAVFIVALLKRGNASAASARAALLTMLRDGRNHTSPNSGIPEAAMAGALGIRMGGPSTYGGILIEKPYIGSERTDDYLAASERAITLVRAAALLGIGISLIIIAAGGGR
ncbi:MAG: adenosylcobinamide-phosphate synthase CbiB [Nitrospirota bacterium]